MNCSTHRCRIVLEEIVLGGYFRVCQTFNPPDIESSPDNHNEIIIKG